MHNLNQTVSGNQNPQTREVQKKIIIARMRDTLPIIMMRLDPEISTLGTGTRTILNFWTVREFYLKFAF